MSPKKQARKSARNTAANNVADVWASAEDLNAFAQNHLMPAFAKHNIAPPSVAIYPTHKVLAYNAIGQFQV